jgi:hypothetical protein
LVKAEMRDGNQWVEDVGATEATNGTQEGSGAVMIMGVMVVRLEDAAERVEGGKTRREAEGLGWCRRVVSACRVVWVGEERRQRIQSGEE